MIRYQLNITSHLHINWSASSLPPELAPKSPKKLLSKEKDSNKNSRAAASPQMGAVTPSFTEYTVYILLKMSCFLTLAPCVFSTHAHKLWFLQDKSASISLRLVAQGVPPPDPGAPTPQHSWRINISHTFFQQLLKPFGHAWHQTRTPRCTGRWDPTPWCPQTAHTCSQLAL